MRPESPEQTIQADPALVVPDGGFGTLETLHKGSAYVLTQDIRRVLQSGIIDDTAIVYATVQTFNQRIATALTRAYPKQSIVIVNENAFYPSLGKLMDWELLAACETGAVLVNIDRYIIKDDADVMQPEPFCRLSIGRMITREGTEILATRPNTPKLQDQIAKINKTLSLTKTIVFVDDGFSSPEALTPYVTIANEQQWQIGGFIVGVCPTRRGEWAETEKIAEQISGRPVRRVLPVVDPIEWTNERDFTLFGGLMVEGDEYPLLAPYIYPFSDGKKASIPSDTLLPISKEVLEANADLIQSIDVIRKRPLTFRDALLAGYGLPTSTLGSIETAQPDELIGQYLKKALQTL